LVRPFLQIVLGINARHRERLPLAGPAIIAANHNSHLDTLALMATLPWRVLPRLRPVAAADYFLKHRLLAWFALRVIGIIPIEREVRGHCADPLGGCIEALDRGEILILFPEGSRGEPEVMSELKSGIAHLVKKRPDSPVVPVLMHGLGKALPKGEALLVPFFCDVFVGEPLKWPGDKRAFMASLESAFDALQSEGHFPEFD